MLRMYLAFGRERGITQNAYFCSLYSKQWKNFEENHFYALR